MSVRDLADYPWDAVAPYAARAKEHPDGIVDLSVGSPVDPTPAVVEEALAAAGDAHAYPRRSVRSRCVRRSSTGSGVVAE